jgi:uncharacterized glyoxalase superfamily protein PhnB
VEIALMVEDVRATYDRVAASDWPRSTELTLQPWGAWDFRILDPDGYYLRISSQDE